MKTLLFAAALTAAFLFAAFNPLTIYANEPDFIKGGDPIEAEATAPPIIPVIEEAPPERTPLTPPGTGTVIDNVTNENGVEFFTITSAAGNIFFLIIDRQRETENVYFLNAVTERDLLALAEEAGEEWEAISTPPPIIPIYTPEVEPEPEATPEPVTEQEQGGNGGMIVILILVILGGGAAGWYFKVYRPKQQNTGMEDDFDYEDDPAEDTDEDITPWDIEEETDKDGDE